MDTNQYEKYRGKRALILTRVSTPKQEEKYSHAAQERQVREKLITPLGLRILDEKRYIIHDTYSGLEYKYREALGHILEMAERGEFDVLCMDVLDRGLGRKGLPRELYRMQLKELGIGILTTDPQDFSDDDSLTGQIMRFHRGIKAEEEITDLVRRSKNGKREKTLGDAAKGIPGKIIGSGDRLYGYEFVLNERGTHIGYTLKHDVIPVEVDGTKWTEVQVVIFIFESAADGISLRGIAKLLNEKGIPTPHASKGKMHYKGMTEEPIWQHNTINNIINQDGYYGEYRQFRSASVGRKPGHKAASSRLTTLEEQVTITIPAIVTKELAAKARRRVAFNKPLATRNNHSSKEALLRGGFAKCANCGGTLHPGRVNHTLASGEPAPHFYYNCSKPFTKKGRCPGCSIRVEWLDAAAEEYIRGVIRDPSAVDAKIQKLQKDNPLLKQQQSKMKNLNAILRDQENFRNNFAAEMRKKTVSDRTIAHLNAQLNLLEQQEQEARRDLADEQRVQEQQEHLQARIAEFHQQCAEWREKLDDSEFKPSFHFYREAVIFLGVSVDVWKSGIEPRHQFYTDPPEIVELLS